MQIAGDRMRTNEDGRHLLCPKQPGKEHKTKALTPIITESTAPVATGPCRELGFPLPCACCLLSLTGANNAQKHAVRRQTDDSPRKPDKAGQRQLTSRFIEV